MTNIFWLKWTYSKLFTITFPIFILFSFVSEDKKQEPIFTVQANLKDVYPFGCALSNQCFYIIECSLYNNTDQRQYFWSLTTCWKDNWFVNRKDIFICNQSCNGNVPKKYSLDSHKKMSFYSVLVNKAKSMDVFKIGFILVKDEELDHHPPEINIYDVIENKKILNKDIYWSNEVNPHEFTDGLFIE